MAVVAVVVAVDVAVIAVVAAAVVVAVVAVVAVAVVVGRHFSAESGHCQDKRRAVGHYGINSNCSLIGADYCKKS